MDDYIKIPRPDIDRKKRSMANTKPASPAPVTKPTAPTKKFGISTMSDYGEAMKQRNKDLEAFERANAAPVPKSKKK